MNESRITELESCIAFQDKTIEDLSGVVCRHQKEIAILKTQYEKLKTHLINPNQPDTNNVEPIVEIPPHF
ncbi:MAG: SlyX family protein [Kiritimatiellae bacterium]|nr:SlyX family protein [Kiritimatiellia bacterium]